MDTRCVRGRRLTPLIYPGKEVVSVKIAKSIVDRLGFEREVYRYYELFRMEEDWVEI